MGLILAALLLMVAPARKSWAQASVDSARSVLVLDTAGSSRTLATYLHGPTLLHIWGTWCSECLDVAPRFNALSDSLRADSIHVVNVAIEVNGLAHWRTVAARVGRGLQLYYDSETADDATGYLGLPWIRSIPAYIAIDTNGVVVGEWYELPERAEVMKTLP